MNLTSLRIFFLLLIVSFSSAFADSSFVVKAIQVNGLQRISEPTALAYLPIKVGDKYNPNEDNQILNALFATGFFTDASLSREHDTLIVTVTERPTIVSVDVEGNKDIPKDKLSDALKNLGLAQGQIFNSATFTQVKQALAEQYYAMGRYNATVTGEATPESRNRVAITIDVSEGLIAQVKQITIVGNHAVNELVLLDQLPMSAPNILTFFNGKDQYGKDKLDKSIQALQDYYLNNGYINMHVDSTEVTMTPDKKYVYIVIHLTEGKQYKFAGFKLTGDFVVPESVLSALVPIKPGEVFSRQMVIDSGKAITDRLGDDAYAFAKANPIPTVDDSKQTVFITYDIDPGNKYYVRRIIYSGNTGTSNIALRNWFHQFEDSLYSTDEINTSVGNLQRQSSYLKPDQITVTPVPVDGTTNKVDLAVKVAEQLSAQLNFNVGYSQAFGFLVGAGITQNNFLGTGKTVGINFTSSSYQSIYSINYFDPFFTPDGISRSVQLYYQTVNPGAVNAANYNTSAYGLSDTLGFPLTNYQTFNLGYGLKHTNLIIGAGPSQQIQDFTNQFGNQFNQILVNAGWDYNTTDRFRLPTTGTHQSVNVSVSLPIGGQNLSYYTTSYTNRFYQPLSNGYILTTYGVAGYGNGYGTFNSLPFFENYFAGGLGTLGQDRAYEPNTLGPLDSNAQPIGGNLLLDGNIALIFPTALVQYNVRTSIFFDAGNVFNTYSASPPGANNFSTNNLAYSVGTQLEWWTPLGMPLIFSLALPVGTQPNAQTNLFQFSIGGTF